ncbi:MAG TPA: TolC family protein, partial [Thermodesulfobacteriota bacterium]|nr:TolC family protein [Thermodesulfobacteriota bacterium]
MNLKKIAAGVVFGLLPLWPGWAMAETPAYSLADLEEIALKTHPSLHISGAEIKKSEADLRIARQYPNPELEGEVSSQKGLENGVYTTGYSIGLSQPIEWPGRRVKKQEAARFGIDAAQNKLTQEQLNVRARSRELYYRVLAGEQLLKNAAENLESAKKLLDLAEKRVSLGESRPIELIKARVEFLTMEREYNQDKALLARDRQILRQFLGEKLPPDFILAGERETLEPLIPLKIWQEAAFGAHPLLAAQAAQVRQAESSLGAERQAWMPDVAVKVFHTKEADFKATGGGLSFPLPLWN